MHQHATIHSTFPMLHSTEDRYLSRSATWRFLVWQSRLRCHLDISICIISCAQTFRNPATVTETDHKQSKPCPSLLQQIFALLRGSKAAACPSERVNLFMALNMVPYHWANKSKMLKLGLRDGCPE